MRYDNPRKDVTSGEVTLQAGPEATGGSRTSLSLWGPGQCISVFMAANNCVWHASIALLISPLPHTTKGSTPSSPFYKWGKVHKEIKKFAQIHLANEQ